MTCSACGHANPDGARFCTECGASVAPRCPHCAAQLPVPARFCPECGGSLTGEAGGRSSLRRPDDAERRHISVLFCDLVGSTELAQKLDPEDLREMVRAYQTACEDVVRELDGEIAQYLGDGILVYFGSPRAHEDDPARAVRAGLQIVEAMPPLNERLSREFPGAGAAPLQVRAAVHSGPVVVGEMGGADRRERLALGDTVNATARILDLAEPGVVLISQTTRRLVQGIFALNDLGAHSLKGIAEPVGVFHAVRSTGVLSRLDTAPPRGHTPLVGRDQEIALLLDRWDQVVEGQGQAVLVSGEAGIGKSRLVHVLRERLKERPHTWLECRCSPYHANSALFPVIELLHDGILLAPEDGPAEQLSKLERAVVSIGFDLDDVLPLFASLLGVPLPEGHPPLELSAEAQRQKTLEALSRWLFTLVEVQPLVLVVEDLHWCDPTTLELIGNVIEQAPTGAILLVATFRPEFTPPWSSRSHLIHLPIHPLTRRQMATMIDSLSGETRLPQEIVDRIMAKTEGVPLFVEEFTKAIVESDMTLSTSSGRLLELGIPSTLQASLMARIDRLGPAKDLAQVCSVLGREFSHELLAAVSDLDDETLLEQIETLHRAELVYQRGVPPRATYSFKHALIQDTAYQSQLRARRQRIHARIAERLEKQFPDIAHAEPELAARHFEEAGLYQQAATYRLRAGERATEQAANDEAIGHCQRGIALLEHVEETPERDRLELRLQVALGVPLQAARGNADPEVEAVYERARKLCRDREDAPSLFRALRGLFAAKHVRGELDAAIELGKQLLALAERSSQPSELLQAHLACGSPYLYQGRYSESLEHLESAVDLYDPAEHRSLAYLYGLDQGVNSRAYAAIALFALGHPERAAQTSRDAVTLARRVNHPYSLATALGWSAVLHQMRREPELTRERAEEAISVSREYGFPTFLGLGLCYRGWSSSGWSGEAGIRECRAGLDQLAESGTSVGGPQLLGVLADAHRRAGDAAQAAQLVDSALAMSRNSGQAVYDSELHRLRGELLLAAHGPEHGEVEAAFRRALEVARSQEAKGWQLRAATSLARVLHGRGDPTARPLLDGIYGWFTEGFELPDLREARALLAEWD